MAFVFQNWPIYKDTRQLRREIGALTKSWPPEEKYVLTNQIRRAILSVLLQIAEGSTRKTDKDKSAFFNRSLASIDEVIACFDAALDDGLITIQQYEDYYKKCESIAKQFRGLDKYLKNSKIIT